MSAPICACCRKPTDDKAVRFTLLHPWAEWRCHPVMICKRCARDLPFRADDALLVPEGMEAHINADISAPHERRVYAGGAVRLIARNVIALLNAANGDQDPAQAPPSAKGRTK